MLCTVLPHSGALRACWLQVTAMEAHGRGDPWARVLSEAAAAALLDAARPMELIVVHAPDTAQELTDGR